MNQTYLPDPRPSLYDRIGGEPAIMATVTLFYEKVLSDERTRRFFGNMDMDQQSRKLVALMAWAFGGPSEYRGRDLRTAHARLVTEEGLSDEHFNAVAEHLSGSLVDLEVEAELIAEVMTLVGSLRNDVLGR
jgi:hemoglobin